LASSTTSVRPCGDDLISIDVPDPARAQALAANLRATGNWLDVVGGIDSVVLRFDAAIQDLDVALKKAADLLDFHVDMAHEIAEVVEIPVHYGGDYGPDLEEVCARLGLSTDEFIALHTNGEHVVEMLGFTPGFTYVGGLDERLDVPRRGEPRTKVAAGSVGIAEGHTGLYALSGPGGWALVGRTSYPLFDASAEDPFALGPGTRIRFVAVDEPGGSP
jgi:KipI family sensor histidine kinase inhibitor